MAHRLSRQLRLDLGLDAEYVDRTALLPMEMLRAILQNLVVERPELPAIVQPTTTSAAEEGEQGEVDENDGDESEVSAVEQQQHAFWIHRMSCSRAFEESVAEWFERSGGTRHFNARRYARDVPQLRWDGGAYDLLTASAVCKRWRDAIAPMLRADMDSLRRATEEVTGDLGHTHTRTKFLQGVRDGHRLCLFAEALKRGALAKCEWLSVHGVGGEPYCNRALAPFGIALGRSLRGGALTQLKRLAITPGDDNDPQHGGAAGGSL